MRKIPSFYQMALKNSLKGALHTFKQYYILSGLKINVDKTRLYG